VASRAHRTLGGTIKAVSVLEFISSLVSSLAWPAVVAVLGFVFRRQLKDLIARLASRVDRLKKVKGPGSFEAEFEDLKEDLVSGPLSGVVEAITISGGDGERTTPATGRDLQIETGTDAEADVDPSSKDREAADSKVHSLLHEARSVVQSRPRVAVVQAGRALNAAVQSTLSSLDIPYLRDGSSEILALQRAGIVDEAEAVLLERLKKLYINALYEWSDEVTVTSALEYVLLVQREIDALDVRRETLLKQKG
jgi:hypothetical protein